MLPLLRCLSSHRKPPSRSSPVCALAFTSVRPVGMSLTSSLVCALPLPPAVSLAAMLISSGCTIMPTNSEDSSYKWAESTAQSPLPCRRVGQSLRIELSATLVIFR